MITNNMIIKLDNLINLKNTKCSLRKNDSVVFKLKFHINYFSEFSQLLMLIYGFPNKKQLVVSENYTIIF